MGCWRESAYRNISELMPSILRNEAYNFFLYQVWNEKLSGKLHQCSKCIDEILFQPIFHSKLDQEKNY
jgi:hypothetical protein